MSASIPRVLIAKPGLDGHDRGAKVIAFALRDAGCEVIYLGLRSTTAEIISTAVDEDVDVIGISVLSGSHIELAAELVAHRDLAGLDLVPTVVGGIIPPRDVHTLLGLGIAAVFPAGSNLTDVVQQVLDLTSDQPAEAG